MLLMLYWARDSAPSPASEPPATENGFYAPGLNAWEALVASVLLVLLGWASLKADQKLAAFGLTLATLASVLASPAVLGNSVGRYVQARQLKAMRHGDRSEARTWPKLLWGAAAAGGVALGAAGGLQPAHEEVGLALNLGAGLLLLFALLGAYLRSVVNVFREIAAEDADLIESDIRRPKPADYAPALAGVLLLIGVGLTFADVYLPDR